jgi:hypothetical protein
MIASALRNALKLPSDLEERAVLFQLTRALSVDGSSSFFVLFLPAQRSLTFCVNPNNDSAFLTDQPFSPTLTLPASLISHDN